MSVLELLGVLSDYEDFDVVISEFNIVDDESYIRLDKQIGKIYVDEKNKELCFVTSEELQRLREFLGRDV